MNIDDKVALELIRIGVIDRSGNRRGIENVGDSDYSEHIIQPKHIIAAYDLPFNDGCIIKRVLRKKTTQSRVDEYRKIIQEADECIRIIEDRAYCVSKA